MLGPETPQEKEAPKEPPPLNAQPLAGGMVPPCQVLTSSSEASPCHGGVAPLSQCSPSGEASGTNQLPDVVCRVTGA